MSIVPIPAEVLAEVPRRLAADVVIRCSGAEALRVAEHLVTLLTSRVKRSVTILPIERTDDSGRDFTDAERRGNGDGESGNLARYTPPLLAAMEIPTEFERHLQLNKYRFPWREVLEMHRKPRIRLPHVGNDQ